MTASPTQSDRHVRPWLICLLLGALLVRVGWGLVLPADPQWIGRLPDQREYLELGRNLLHGNGLKFFDPRFSQDVFAYRMPGYPALVAVCGGNIRAVRVAQALIDTSTVLAVYFMARRWLGTRASLFAGLLVAANPFLVYFSGLLLSETLFIAMLAWGMLLIVYSRWVSSAVLLALAVLVRPSALVLVPLLPLVLGNLRRTVIATGVLLAVLAPWAYRNSRVVGDWVWTTTNSGITLYDGLHEGADGSSNQQFLKSMTHLRFKSEQDRSAVLAEEAADFAIGNPAQAIRLAARKIARTWSPMPLSDEFGSNRLYVSAALLFCIPLDLLVVWGLWRGTLSRPAKVFLLLPAIYFTASHAITVGSLRYRVPAEVPMAVVAASCYRTRFQD